MALVTVTPPLREMTREQLEDLMTAAQEEKKNREARRFGELRLEVMNAIETLANEFPDAIFVPKDYGDNVFANAIINISRYR